MIFTQTFYFFKKTISLILIIVLISCTEDNLQQSSTMVPSTTVNTSINDISFINSPGSFTTIPSQGYLGIIVFNIDGNTFSAFDLGCPYLNIEDCQVPMIVNELTQEMSCATCNNDDITFTQYQTGVTITEGDTTNTYFLRRYNAFLENGRVIITNF